MGDYDPVNDESVDVDIDGGATGASDGAERSTCCSVSVCAFVVALIIDLANIRNATCIIAVPAKA